LVYFLFVFLTLTTSVIAPMNSAMKNSHGDSPCVADALFVMGVGVRVWHGAGVAVTVPEVACVTFAVLLLSGVDVAGAG
jgi:hypothetical protein